MANHATREKITPVRSGLQMAGTKHPYVARLKMAFWIAIIIIILLVDFVFLSSTLCRYYRRGFN